MPAPIASNVPARAVKKCVSHAPLNGRMSAAITITSVAPCDLASSQMHTVVENSAAEHLGRGGELELPSVLAGARDEVRSEVLAAPQGFQRTWLRRSP